MDISVDYLCYFPFLQTVENGKVYYGKDNFIVTEDSIYGWLVCHDMETCFGTDAHIKTVDELERLYHESTGMFINDD